MRYAVVLERGDRSWSAYVPDLPGCVATGESREAAEASIQTAIAMHLQGLRDDGADVPPPSSVVEYIDVAA